MWVAAGAVLGLIVGFMFGLLAQSRWPWYAGGLEDIGTALLIVGTSVIGGLALGIYVALRTSRRHTP